MNAIEAFRHTVWINSRELPLAALLLFLPLASPGDGVVAECTESSLRSAMAGGGIVTFACDGTITLAATITNTADTVLDGRGHQLTISGGNVVRIFQVATNVQFTAANLILADGFSPGGSAILNVGGTVNLTGVMLRTNFASTAAGYDGLMFPGAGGAIQNVGGVIAATNCSFTGNTAVNLAAFSQACGGAIGNGSGQVNLERCTFEGNQTLGGPAPYPQVMGNVAAGGAIQNSGALVADGCTFAQNSATAGAGYSSYGSGSGGGAAFGGAVCNSGALSISRSTFASNSATGGNGGPGYAAGFNLEWGLPGGAGGAGGFGDGGAVFNSGTGSMINCTIAWNSGRGGEGGAGGQGGGSMHVGGQGGNGGNGGNGFGGVDGTCNLTNCTLVWNTGSGGSGGSGGLGGVGGSGSGWPGAAGASGTVWGGTVCSTLVNTLIASNAPAGNDSFPDPKLGPLADNGGPTLTVALLPGSPAIDAGNRAAAPPTDQRGVPRPFGATVDLGAYEYTALLRISRSTGSGLDIFLRDGSPGQTCRLLTSTTLSDWVCVSTNQVGTNGTFLFQENCEAGESQRFYKVALP